MFRALVWVELVLVSAFIIVKTIGKVFLKVFISVIQPIIEVISVGLFNDHILNPFISLNLLPLTFELIVK